MRRSDPHSVHIVMTHEHGNGHTSFQGSSSTTHQNGTDPIPEAAEKRMPNAAGEGGRNIKGDVKRTKESFSAQQLVLREFPQKEKPALECQPGGREGERVIKLDCAGNPNRIRTDFASVVTFLDTKPVLPPCPVPRWRGGAHGAHVA